MPFTPVTFTDGVTPLNKATFDALQAGVIAAERTENKAVANGYASLDGTGKVPVAQTPLSPVTNGQWVKGVGGVPVWSAITAADVAGLPGQQLAYAQTTSSVTGIVGTSFATGTNIATLASPTMDGSTVCMFECFAPSCSLTIVGQIVFALNDGGANLGWIGTYGQQVAGASPGAFYGAIRFTPTAGPHSYAALCWVSGGTASVTGGPGGASQFWPIFVRLIRA